MPERMYAVERTTGETQVQVQLKINGSGKFHGATGVPFLAHMLNLWARHGLFDLSVNAKGDLEIDAHHTVEDIGITMGQALNQALGERRGIKRYGSALIPMDEALLQVAVDISGRPYLAYDVFLSVSRIGNFDTELVEEFLRAFSLHAGLTIHIRMLQGKNTHHIIEALFKALGRALREACELDPRTKEIPSTKGVLV